ncbi:cytochrome C oxidase subunit IV family protein [Rosettibacter firmus]|uniref:cytochrome C oxidase subunit IV family protein n=1 Tax=Rosettibacter firmus TaxID=3111522 RepID=UPI00336BE19D
MKNHNNHISILTYVIVWISLLALTSITVTVAGLNLEKYTLFIALIIASIKSALVINIFMHIKFDEPIFKVFLALSGTTLIILFVLTFFDIIYR